MKQGFIHRFAREAVYLVIGLVIAALGIAAMMAVSRYLLQSFAEQQVSSITARCERVIQAFSQESDHLLSMLSEYSYWDKTYAFEKGENAGYIEEEFSLSTMIFGRVNTMILFNDAGKYVGGASLRENDIAYNVPAEIIAEFERNQSFLRPATISHGHVGFLQVKNDFYLFACRAVSNTDMDAPAAGALVFGRLLDEQELSRLNTLVDAKIKITRATGEETQSPWHISYSGMMDGCYITFSNPLEAEEDFCANILVKDIAGEHKILITVEFPAVITTLIKHAVRLINFSMIAMIFVSFVFVFILIVELSRRSGQIQQRILEAEELEKARLDAENLAKRATAADQAKSQFLAIMSHEVRTPLNAILGFSTLLRTSSLSIQQREQINNIHASGEVLLRVINDILDFSKIEAGKLDLDNSECQLDEIVNEVRDLFQLPAKNKGLDLEVSMAPNVPRRILCDRTRLLQILGNLVSNAIKFTDFGGVFVHITCAKPGETIDSYADFGLIKIRFSVRDTGIGISADAQEKLFQTFSQVDSSMSRKHGGTGLGLAISRRLCHLMGGEIWLESSTSKGSEFIFEIGIEAANGPVTAKPLQPVGDEAFARTSKFKNLRVLLVEDNLVNRKLMVSILAKMDITPDQSADGVEALAKVEKAEYDAIFMDLQMPEMDGLLCTRKIREYERHTRRKPSFIIALTAAAFPEDIKKCSEVGMDGFLPKPIRVDELRRILENLAIQMQIMTGS